MRLQVSPKGCLIGEMCCFSTTTDVRETAIFARVSRPGTQVLAYRMTYSAKAPTAMILPLPVALPARENAVRFKNLKEYPDFFSGLESAFPPPEEGGFFRSKSAGLSAASATLEVHEVGDFVASFVPSMADFSRLDPRFVLSKQVWAKFPAYKDYGFAVFQLKSLAGEPHPMAFEFDTRLKETAFFPTVHIHDGSVHAKADFDHALYLQAKALDARAGSYDGPTSVDKNTGFVRSAGPAKGFVNSALARGLIDPELLIHKTTLRGLLPNRDTLYDLEASATKATGCSLGDLGAATTVPESTSSVLAVTGIGWLLARRMSLQKR